MHYADPKYLKSRAALCRVMAKREPKLRDAFLELALD